MQLTFPDWLAIGTTKVQAQDGRRHDVVTRPWPGRGILKDLPREVMA